MMKRQRCSDCGGPLVYQDDIATCPVCGLTECGKCGGDGARHVAGEPVWQEPCGECSGEGMVSPMTGKATG